MTTRQATNPILEITIHMILFFHSMGAQNRTVIFIENTWGRRLELFFFSANCVSASYDTEKFATINSKIAASL